MRDKPRLGMFATQPVERMIAVTRSHLNDITSRNSSGSVFAFNGQLANYPELREQILSQTDFHLARETDTEIMMHLLCHELQEGQPTELLDVLTALSERVDGAYNIVFLNALGDMFVSRDPLGIRPLCYAKEGALFAAAR